MTHKELISQLRLLASQLQNTAVTLTEALEPKAEQVQPPVQQPDAALVSDEPPGSAAGNPDDSLAELKNAIKTYRRKLFNRYAVSDSEQSRLLLEDVTFAMDKLLSIVERVGAA